MQAPRKAARARLTAVLATLLLTISAAACGNHGVSNGCGGGACLEGGTMPDASFSEAPVVPESGACSAQYTNCTSSSQCCSGLQCSKFNGFCDVCSTGATPQCSVDADCCTGYVCNNSTGSACCKPGGTCGWDAACSSYASCCDGEVCDVPFNMCPATGKTSTCHPPTTEFATCKPLIGCGGGLLCGNASYPEFGMQSLCAQPCTSGSQCPDIETSCQALGLSSNVCAPADCGPGIDATGWFQPCNNRGTSDGLCLPYCNGVCSPSSSTAVIGRCVAGGTLPAGSACSFTGAQCAPGTYCVTETGGSFCRTLCDPYGRGGPTCTGGTTCVVPTSGGFPDTSKYWGYCR